MKKKSKILSLGLSQSNFIIQLYSQILNYSENYEFDVNEFFDLSKNKAYNNVSCFNKMYEFSKVEIVFFNYIKFFFLSVFSKDFWTVILFEIFTCKQGIVSSLKHIHGYIIQNATVNKVILPLKHDIYHFHYCTPESIKYLRFLPNNSKIICSFWGSDLLRTSGVRNSFYIKPALEKASVISVQSLELKEIILAKYGRQLEPKINLARFTINTNIFDSINEVLRTNGRNAFLEKYNIDGQAKIITVAYNAKEENNHIPIIKAINKLPNAVKNKLAIVLPYAYGINESYIKKLNTFLSTTTNLKYTIIKGFLPSKETAQLRAFTDVQIQMPISDALSGSVMEVMYSGNFVIAGSWLPYSPYDNAGLTYYKVENFKKLTPTLNKILKNFESLKKNHLNNKNKIEDFFFPKLTSQTWINLYNKINE